jgi:transposase
MKFVGVDLHKKTITLCVMNEKLTILARRTLYCNAPETILEFFQSLGPFQVTVEATASYHWLVELIEPLAERVVLANPNKLRVIAESTKKTDRLDAQVLAEFLVRDQIPQAYQPTPRIRQHRALVRQRHYLRGRMTSVKNKVRRILSDYNADCKNLFSANRGLEYIAEVPLSEVDRFLVNQLWAEFQHHDEQLGEVGAQLRKFAKKAPQREKEVRAVLKTAPGVGPVTTEVLISELGDVGRFKNAKTVCAYAGLVPAVRQTGDKKSKDLPITKKGSALLRWALVEASWRTIRTSRKWERIFERISKRSGGKRAIVAVARKLLCVLYAMLKTMTPYKILAT